MYAQLYNPKTIEKKYSKITITNNQRKIANEWIKKLKNNELEKEKKNYFVFRDVVLRDLLGYPEEKILYEEKNVEFSIQDEHGDTGVCFEAKGTKTKDLFARQGYEKKEQENPVVQTLSNMERFPASYGVCTNYRNFVLLDRKKKLSKCHRFDFLSIENSDKKLKEFLGIFSYKNLVIEKTLDDLYNSSVSEEREFTNEFYKLFHETRLMLIKAFQEKEKVTMDEAIHYAQLYLNRLIFIFFMEDKGDLEDRLFSKRVLKILEVGQCTESTRSVSDDILKLFKYLDKGSDVQGIFGFNGGLFNEKIPPKIYFFDLKNPEFFQEVKQYSKLSKKIQLDELSSKIVKKYKDRLNPIISNLLIMDSFDFNTELNVNILGHIFEKSISDLEDLRKEKISKRKEEGVFYTPEYVTEYICTSTIIPYLSKNNASTITELIGEYLENPEELESRIRKIKILDPACGSGAFLVKAIEILLEIDKEIQNIKPQTNEQTHLEDWSEEKEITKIIENNVYGVDINEESVQITKLSLFLKMATVNRKLLNLSENIRIGNSLVDDNSVDSKAFDWKNEFKEIIDEGFDIIIGNPPYLRIQGLHESHEHMTEFFEKNYLSATGRYDYYVLFLEKGAKLLKKNSHLGFIVPHKFIVAAYGKGIRKYFSENNLIRSFVNFGHNYVFEDATVYTGIVLLENKKNNVLEYKEFRDTASLEVELASLTESDFVKIPQTEFGEKMWVFHSGKTSDILNKIKNSGPNIMEFFDKILQGVITGDDDLYYLHPVKDKGKTMILFSDKIQKDVEVEKEVVKPLLVGEDVKRYKFPQEPNNYVIYPYVVEKGKQRPLEENELKSNFPLTYKYLYDFKSELIPLRKKFKTNPKYWHGLHRARQLTWFNQEKVITPEITLGCNMTVDPNNYLHNTQVYSFLKKESNKINIGYFLAILNSKLLWFFLKSRGNVLRGGYLRFQTRYFESFHIPLPNKEIEKDVVEKIEQLQKLHKDFDEQYIKFQNRLETQFNIENPSKKLENFYEMSFKEFLLEIKKSHKISLEPKKEDKWEDYFESYKKNLIELKTKSDRLDHEINQTVNKIYGLSDEEISIIDKEYPESDNIFA